VVSEILASSASVPRYVPHVSVFCNKAFMPAYIPMLDVSTAAAMIKHVETVRIKHAAVLAEHDARIWRISFLKFI